MCEFVSPKNCKDQKVSRSSIRLYIIIMCGWEDLELYYFQDEGVRSEFANSIEYRLSNIISHLKSRSAETVEEQEQEGDTGNCVKD